MPRRQGVGVDRATPPPKRPSRGGIFDDILGEKRRNERKIPTTGIRRVRGGSYKREEVTVEDGSPAEIDWTPDTASGRPVKVEATFQGSVSGDEFSIAVSADGGTIYNGSGGGTCAWDVGPPGAEFKILVSTTLVVPTDVVVVLFATNA